ncbi:hypothetical protein N0Y54_33310 [Nostoc punctiforme UO1]
MGKRSTFRRGKNPGAGQTENKAPDISWEQRDFVRSAKKGAIAKNLFICT